MSRSFTPFFPPLILEKCLDLAKLITENKTGRANLKINLGNSRFDFAFENSSSSKAPDGISNKARKSKKKSSSDQRRDFLRRQKFLEKKRSSCPENTPPLSASSNPSLANVSAQPAIKESPLNAEVSNDTETLEEIVDTNTSNPVIENTRIMEVDVPPPISPISSPSSISNADPPKPITLLSPNNFRIDLNANQKDLPPELIENHSDETISISVLLKGRLRSSETSLRRTLKKCNLRSIEPKLYINLEEKARTIFHISIRKIALQTTLLSILENWISFEDVQPPCFRVSIGEKTFVM